MQEENSCCRVQVSHSKCVDCVASPVPLASIHLCHSFSFLCLALELESFCALLGLISTRQSRTFTVDTSAPDVLPVKMELWGPALNFKSPRTVAALVLRLDLHAKTSVREWCTRYHLWFLPLIFQHLPPPQLQSSKWIVILNQQHFILAIGTYVTHRTGHYVTK